MKIFSGQNVFVFDKWIKAGKLYESGNTTIVGAVPVDYKIHVTTADIKHAGTDDDCFIDIVGEKGETDKNVESSILF